VNPRIALLTTNLAPGGAETQVARLAILLAGRGWPVMVISLLAPTAFAPDLEAAGVRVVSLEMERGWRVLAGAVRLAAILRQTRPQILHSHMFHANMLARAARLVFPVPVVVSTLHSAAESGRDSDNAAWRDRLYRLTDRVPDAVVAVSAAVAARHAEAKAAGRSLLRVIPNGVATDRFRPDADARARLRRELSLGDEFVWLAAGRLMWKKDYPAMLEASALVPGGVLLIAGEGPDLGSLQALAARLRVRARFLGGRDDIPALMAASDAFVLSSKVEGLPVVLLEAAASGLPIVTTTAGGAAEAVVEGETGFAVPAGDAAAFGAAMSRVMALPAPAREAMGHAARRLAIDRFDERSVAAQWEALYSELLEHARWT
jgi:glycosyltransferase involved in cell wall biosynthesis